MTPRFPIPRKISFAHKPYRGVTLRQMIYLVVGAASGGLLLINQIGDLDLIIRGVIALLIFGVFLALAYVPIQGGHLDSWLPHVLRYLFRPRLRVWRKTGPDEGTGLVESADLAAATPAPPLVPAAAAAKESILDRPIRELLPFGFLIDALVIVALILLTVYLVQQGYQTLAMLYLSH
jgi:hypothetical protein